ncbi:unnamed protein product [Medioppia subpectinata]|uniref:PHD-type domain-containing protein n=1 Tax=Medioppia subpectinata TaxID=1979941 RepID=A0A7R9KDT7_9ACAR|nr:unnamed protein product [Medioppia subpectinata]CAG2101694.1 unnamed protein product [Medioppia subpectinata]
MAASMLDQTGDGQHAANQCENDGNFAVICSFFYKFSESLGITYNIQHLKEMIEDSNHLSEELVELHIKLLRKRRKYINKDKWERALVKFCAEYSNVDSWELERYGYKNSKLSIKLELLKRLLEAQFDYNSKFKLEVNAIDAQTLRILPMGRDVNGHMYWYQLDPEYNFRIYREEVEDEQSWLLVCQNKTQLEALITNLQTNNTIDALNKEETSSLSDTNDDTNSNLNIKLSHNLKQESNSNSVDMEVKTPPVEPKVSAETKVLSTKTVANEVTKECGDEKMMTEDVVTCIREVCADMCTKIESNSVSKCAIKCEPKTEQLIRDHQKSLTLEIKAEPMDDTNESAVKSVANGLIGSEKTSILSHIKCETTEELDLKANCLNTSAKVSDFVVKTDDNKQLSEEKTIFDEIKSEVNGFEHKICVNNNQIENNIGSDFYFNTDSRHCKTNIDLDIEIDSQTVCDVKDVMEGIVGRVSDQLCPLVVQSTRKEATNRQHNSHSGGHSSGAVTDMTLLSIEQTVSVLCDSLVDDVCKESEQTDTSTASGGRGRGRGRGRGSSRGRGRGRGRASASVAKVNIYNKSNRSRSKSSESRDERAEEEEAEEESFPQKRTSRRIQALQERKAIEMSEQLRKEQQRIEQLAKKRNDLIAAKTDDQSVVSNGTKKKGRKQLIESEEEEGEEEEEEAEEEEVDSDASEDKKHKKKRGRKRKNGPNSKPWEESDSSKSSAEEEEEEHEDEEEEEVLKFEDNDDEFACEESDSDAEPVVVRRARTVRKVRSDSSDSNSSSSESEVENDDKPCGRCGKYDHPEWILLCDKCDDGFHTACLRPPLLIIPAGEWFCPPCEHKMLCEKLCEELSTLAVHLAKKEREELRKQRLKYVAISVDNILKNPVARNKSKSQEFADDLLAVDEDNDGGGDENAAGNELADGHNETNNEPKAKSKHRKRVVRSDDDDDEDNSDEDDDESDREDDIGRALWSDEEEEEEVDKYAAIKSRRNRSRKNINYKFSEYDQMIKSAIEMEIEYDYDPEEVPASGVQSKGKDMSNIIASTTEELDFSITPIGDKVDAPLVDKSQELLTNESVDKASEGTTPMVKAVVSEGKKIDGMSDEEEAEAEEEEDDDEYDTDESFLKSKSKQNNKRTKGSKGSRKRHRGLNDLSDTTEDDDYKDEDFKGDDSDATEVGEGSDEDFDADDGSTQEDEEASDDSDFKYTRRRSGRNARQSSKKSSKSRGKSGRNSGRRGYRRDAFVVDSDESEGDFRGGRSKARGGRAAARKKVSYAEETETETDEEKYYKPATNKKKKSRNDSESSDEEWGRQGVKESKTSKAERKLKKLWEESDDEEEDEEEDNDNEDEDNDNEGESEEEGKSEAKPGPKSSKPAADAPPAERLSMKGKPRLSKARGLANLKEDSDDDEDSDSNVKKSTKSNKKSKRVVESDDEISDKVSEKKPKPMTGADTTVQNKSELSERLGTEPIKSGVVCDPTLMNQSLTDNQVAVEAISVPPPLLHNKDPQLSSSMVPITAVPHMTGPPLNSYPPHPTDNLSMKPTPVPHMDPNYHKTNNNVDEYYSLTPMDGYPVSRPPPLKPTSVADPYHQSSSPPRIMSLDPNPGYPRHPQEYPNAPIGHPLQATKGLMDPRMENPYIGHSMPPNVRPMHQFAHQPPPLRNDLRPMHGPPHSGHPFGGHYYPPVPPEAAHPYYARPPVTRHDTPPYSPAHIRPPTNSPMNAVPPPGAPPRTTAPPTSSSMPGQPPPNYRPPSGPHWGPQTSPNRSPMPAGYSFPGHPHPSAAAYYSRQPGPPGQPIPGHQSAHMMPLPPSPYPHSPYQSYGYFGPNAGPGAPNGAFMMANLLQHRPHAPEEAGPPGAGHPVVPPAPPAASTASVTTPTTTCAPTTAAKH